MLGFHCTLGCRRHEKTQARTGDVLFTPWQCGFHRCSLVRIGRYLGSSKKHLPKQSFHSIVESCQNDLRARQGLSGFLDAEQQHGSVAGLYPKLNEWLASNCGQGWESMDAQELLEQLVASPDWEPYVSQAVDLGLFLGTIQTVQFLASNSGGRMEDVRAPAARDDTAAAAPKAVRRRLRGKQTPARAPVEPALVGDPVAPARDVPPPPHLWLESGRPNLGLRLLIVGVRQVPLFVACVNENFLPKAAWQIM